LYDRYKYFPLWYTKEITLFASGRHPLEVIFSGMTVSRFYRQNDSGVDMDTDTDMDMKVDMNKNMGADCTWKWTSTWRKIRTVISAGYGDAG
jgi:hypothetical protein